MSEITEMTHKELMEGLPPQSRSPILQKLAKLGFSRFQTSYAIETPYDYETGQIDHFALVQSVAEMVDPDYQWKAPFFDEHHLFWYAHRYNTTFQQDPELAVEFRNMATNKLWVPRQFHNMIHAVTLPPPVPDQDTMRREVKLFRRHSFMYRIANEAMRLEHLRNVSEQVVSQKGEVWFVDFKTKSAVTDLGLYDQQRSELIRFIENAHARGLIDLSQLTSLDAVKNEGFGALIPEIKRLYEQGLARADGKLVGRSVEIPYTKVA